MCGQSQDLKNYFTGYFATDEVELLIFPLGSKWLKLFLRRHDNISVRTSQNIGKNRLVTVKQIKGWFEEVDKYFSDNNFSGILQDPKRVLATKGSKIVYIVSGNSDKENITSLICTNMAGELAPCWFSNMNVYLISSQSQFLKNGALVDQKMDG